MAWRFDSYDQSLVIDGFQNGIAPDPYEGISNLQNANISSVPAEVSTGFSTTPVYQAPNYSNVAVSGFGSNILLNSPDTAPLLENGQAVYFNSSTITNVGTNTVYWVTAATHSGGNLNFKLLSTYGGTTAVAAGSTGTAAMYTYNMVLNTRGPMTKNYMLESKVGQTHWLLDSDGLVWSDLVKTSGATGVSSTNSWTYTGNTGNQGTVPDTTANGNGFVYMPTVYNGGAYLDGWLFVWRNSAIDYMQIETQGTRVPTTSLQWVYGWKPSTGTTAVASGYLNNPPTTVTQHEALLTPDNLGVSYGDAYTIGRFYQTISTTTFNPTDLTTYTWNSYGILPPDDVAQCLTFMGGYVYIGGRKNVIYPWDRFSNQPSNPIILLAENNVISLVTVNTNMYIFCGNRGRIYVSNGSQASPWQKVPDHLSGTIQPSFTWAGATFNLNKLYFGLFGVANGTSGSRYTAYDGIWEANLETQAIAISDTLSNGGYPSAFLPQNISFETLAGYGLYAGWGGGTPQQYGIDLTTNTVATAVIETDLIPIGTYLQARNFDGIEYRLRTPMIAGDSIAVAYRPNSGTGYTPVFTDSTAGRFSHRFPINFSNTQWAQFKITLTPQTTNPSYIPLREIRIHGLKGPTLGNQPQISA